MPAQARAPLMERCTECFSWVWPATLWSFPKFLNNCAIAGDGLSGTLCWAGAAGGTAVVAFGYVVNERMIAFVVSAACASVESFLGAIK